MTTNFSLTAWQKKQAALLYYFSSLEYLVGLRDRLRALRSFADGILDVSRHEGRDSKLRSGQWGNRNTSENWENNAWPFLADFQRSVAENISNRVSNIFGKTAAHQCARGIAEFSMHWSTPGEQQHFDKMFAELYQYARYIDQTMDRTSSATRWTDFGLSLAWQNHATRLSTIPKFVARPDLTAHSGQLPPRTGVYVSIDDSEATLQFAWTGSPDGKLLDGTTFNRTGRAAAATVGRAKLWTDGEAMLRFVLDDLSNPDLSKDPFFEDSRTPELAPSLVARNAFTSCSSRWCYVEIVKDEFEPASLDVEEMSQQTGRFEVGQHCTREGFYFSPADAHSRRHFQHGEQFPLLRSEYGKTIWQWDQDQNK
ncbi:hypothetical protein [Massilia litorea]|uniref:Uncharacterized protein n=1 Tax=Massilia litorea TaxID=2769491 RepID=A0A7L9U6A3_9BURK|nr:hypothetical protein [Massilia litorea]QOL49685.1 hypothetical protein LPB04_22890 [Massilia litorea]